MKKFSYSLLVMVLAITGCSDLEEDPQGLLAPDTFFNTPEDIQTVVNGAIGNMATETYWGRKLSFAIMLKSDMVSIGDQGTPQRRRDINAFQVTTDNGMITEFWPRAYQIIAGTNEAIFQANLIEADPEQLLPIKGQAHFLRAHTYYHMVRLFGDIPYIDQPVTDIDESKTFSKTPAAEVYANIIADFEEAKAFLPDLQPTRSLPSKAAAAAYLASVYLTLGDFQKAYDEAKFVIDNEGQFDLALEPDFQNLFNADVQESLKEPLFALDFNGLAGDGGRGDDFGAPMTGIRANENGINGEGWSVAVPTIEVYNTWDGKDYRKAVSLDTTGIFNGVEEPFSKFPDFDARNVQSAYIAKYTRFPGFAAAGNGRASSTNYALMRYAEVLLIAAEALNEISPGSTEATGYVNRVRERARNGNPSASPQDVAAGLSQADFRDMVLEERRLELAFEFKRWYDIQRRQLGNEVFAPGSLEPQPNFDPARDYLFPLPFDELERNPNLAPNNPGY